MTTPISFTAMNKAVAPDAADMPHVLGDPTDGLWAGTSERCNDNFAAFNTFATGAVTAAHPSALLSGTAVPRRLGAFFRAVWLLPRMSPSVVYALLWLWVVDPNEGGWAWGRVLTFANNARLVHLDVRVKYTGAAIMWTTDDGIFMQSPNGIVFGTLAAGIRPAFGYTVFIRACGAYLCTNASSHTDSTFDLYYNSTSGVLTMAKLSTPTGVTFALNYLTNSSTP